MPPSLASFAIGVPFASTGETDPVWPSILDALKERVPLREAQTLVWRSQFLRRHDNLLAALISDSILHDWMRAGWLEHLRATVQLVTQNRSELAVCPVRDVALSKSAPHRTLEQFVWCDANVAARAEIQRLVREPTGTQPLLALSGPAGTGKSHLLLGLAAYAAAQGKRVLYVPAESFTLAVMEAAQRKTIDAFRAVLGGAELVILDGLERLAGRDGSQRHLAYVLDLCQEGHLDVAIGARRSLPAMKGLSALLAERLDDAREIAVGVPDAATRVELVRRRISAWGVQPDDDTCSWIAEELSPGMGELDVALTRMLTHPGVLDGFGDTDILRRRLRSGRGSESARRAALPPSVVLEQISRHFNVRPFDLRGPGRSPRLTLPRQIAMYMLRRHSGLSYPEIGKRMRRHHTTAMHACKRVDARRQQDTNLRATLGLLEKELTRLATERNEGEGGGKVGG